MKNSHALPYRLLLYMDLSDDELDEVQQMIDRIRKGERS